jgi:hypothetical protein
VREDKERHAQRVVTSPLARNIEGASAGHDHPDVWRASVPPTAAGRPRRRCPRR